MVAWYNFVGSLAIQSISSQTSKAAPIVGFKYTKIIAGKIFNQTKVVEDLDVIYVLLICVVIVIQVIIVMTLFGTFLQET